MLPLLLIISISSISTEWADDYNPTSYYHTQHIHLQVDANNSFKIVGLHNVLQLWATQQTTPMREYMVARENLTARIMSFAYPSGMEERGDDLLHDLAQGLCSFKPFRLPLHELRNEKGRYIYTTIQLGYDFKAHFANTLNKHGFIDYAEDHKLMARVILAQMPQKSGFPRVTWPEKQFYPEFVQYIPRLSLVHCWTYDDQSKLPNCLTYASADADC